MVRKFILSQQQKFEALKMRYEDHVELLRVMTKHDYQLFGGYTSIQLALGSFFAATTSLEIIPKLGVLIADGALTVIAVVLLNYSRLRREEAVETLKNVMTAFRFSDAGEYLPDKPINHPGRIKFWGRWYIAGVITEYVGVFITILSARGAA
jgi:hypothetical protein